MKIFQYLLNPFGRPEAVISIRVKDGRAYVGIPGATEEIVVLEDHPIGLSITIPSPESRCVIIEGYR